MHEASLFLLSVAVLWVGATLLLSELRWFARVPLVERLRPYAPGGMAAGRAAPKRALSAESFRDVLGPLAQRLGERVARLFGVSEQTGLRLERMHSDLDATGFRVRQVGWAVAGLGLAGGFVGAVRPSPGLSLLSLLGGPLLAFLVQEQRLAAASSRWQRRVFLELPVVTEQLAMLLSAGYSLGSALQRVSARGRGCCAADLRRVVLRVRQGLSEAEALREWAAVARVDAVDRLVPLLALNRDAPDLGRLLSAEARSVRKDVQRELVEAMDRRGQAVWIPVTVATLVPGVIFLAVPFLEALRLFSGS
ncbi:MAG: tight adherence protein [Acidimicrobiaceae bacterium]|nr:tight adherence protein [Acidimicrobiaceae bacterium]